MSSDITFTSLKEYAKERLDSFLSLNKKTFINEFERDLPLGNVSLYEVFSSIYNPDNKIKQLGDKSFFRAYAEKRQDFNVKIDKEENLFEKVPKEYTKETELLNAKNFHDINSIQSIEFVITCTHPILKQRFIGPEQLDVTDRIKIFFVSPLCLVIEVTSSMTGFMMMDTFQTTMRYTYQSEPIMNSNNSVEYQTKLSVEFTIEFVKDTWWKNKITSEAVSDNSELVKETMVPLIKTVLNDIKNRKEKTHKKEKKEEKVEERKPVIPEKAETISIQKEEKINVKQSVNESVNKIYEKFENTNIIVIGLFMILVVILLLRNNNEVTLLSMLNILGFGVLLFKINTVQSQIEQIQKMHSQSSIRS